MAGGPADPREQRRRLEQKAADFAKKVLREVADGRKQGLRGAKYRLEQVTSRLTLLPIRQQEDILGEGVTADAALLTSLSKQDLGLFVDCTLFQPASWAAVEVEMVQALFNAPQEAKSRTKRSRNVAMVLAATGIHGLPAQVASYISDHKEAVHPIGNQMYTELKRRIDVRRPVRDVTAAAQGLPAPLAEWYRLWEDANSAWGLYKMGPEVMRDSNAVADHHRGQARRLLRIMCRPPQPPPAPRPGAKRGRPPLGPNPPSPHTPKQKPQQGQSEAWEQPDQDWGDQEDWDQESESDQRPGSDGHGAQGWRTDWHLDLEADSGGPPQGSLTVEEQENLVMRALAQDAQLLKEVVERPGGAAARQCHAYARETYEEYKRRERGEGPPH